MPTYKNPIEQSKQMRKDNNTFSMNGKRYWIGSVNALDGKIEETHPYNKAKQYDFHHSFYFSEPQLDKLDRGENVVFFVGNDGKINLNPTARYPGSDNDKPLDEKFIIDQILKQIKIGE